MKRTLDRIEIKNEVKTFSEVMEGELIEYDYIEVFLYDKDDFLLEIWRWQSTEPPTSEEFFKRTGCKIGVSCWSIS